jgi:ABC-type nitrate/sulfonate/bicarbonate transport system permease component
MVVSEMVGASQGIGAVTLLAQQSFAYEQMWAGMVLVALLGLVLNGLFGVAERAVVRQLGVDVDPLTAGGFR